jgi:hypothetical protein
VTGHAIVDDLNAVIFSTLTSGIPKWYTFIFLKWKKNMKHSTWNQEVLYADRSLKVEQILRSFFVRNQKYEHGLRLKIDIRVLFNGENS